MEKFRILSLFGMLFLLATIYAEEDNGYIFTCPRSLTMGAKNQVQLQRYGSLDAGVFTVKVTYKSNYNSNESIAFEKVFDIEEGVADSYLQLYLKPSETRNYYYEGKITINGTFGDYVIGGVDKISFSTSKSNIGLIQTDKPLYKAGQIVKFRVLRVDKKLKPLVKDNADIWVEDPQGTRLFQRKNVSLGRGIKQFEFPLADEPVKGNWRISASFKGEVTTTTFEVKEYVLPTFEVKVKIPPFVLSSAEEIPISICANYTYGKPVNGYLKMNISLESYYWENKVPTLEYDGQIDGCFEYNINVSLIETNNYYYYRRIKIVASVEESGTGVQRNETQYITRTSQPLTLSFNQDQRQFYKPGLPYNGKLFVKQPDNTAAPYEDIEICYKVKRDRVLMNGKWQATRTVKYCQNFTSDEEGVIEFIIPRQNTDSLQINIEAKSLKYARDSSKPGTPRQTSLSQPQTSTSINPWFSPSGSFIQLQQVQETLRCGTRRKIKLLFTSKTDADFEFHYQVLHQGKVVQAGVVEKSFSVSDDVADQYEDENKVVDDVETQVVPLVDGSEPTESDEEEECSFAKDTRYLPPVGEVDIKIDVSASLTPSFRLLTYYVRGDRETVADSQKFTVQKCFKNKVKLRFGDDVKQPGTTTSVTVTSSPNSLCGIKVIDKGVILLNSDDQLTPDKIFRILESFDNGMYYGINHCAEVVHQPGLYKSSKSIIWPPRPVPSSSSPYEDSLTAFENAGFLVISDLTLFTRPCKPREEEVYRPIRYYKQAFRGGMALASRASVDNVNFDMRAESATQSVVSVRDFFPDTWLFSLEATGPDGVYQKKEKLPHSITEWVGSAVCINNEDGLGLSNTTSIKGFQAFFISLTLPYSVIRGELFWITVSIFNYVDKPLPIKVSLNELQGFEVTSGSIDGDICVYPGSSNNLKLQLKGTALGKLNITVQAESSQSSDVCGSDVSDAYAKDAIRNSIIVEAEGWPAEEIESVLFCPKDEENGIFKRTFSLNEPEDVVPDSSRAFFDATGNVLGKGLDNLENLVEQPTGCGEQNMVKFAPNVVAMDVLVETKQLTDNLKSKIINNLNTGAQRQLQYRHPDGSFSAFGTRDKEGSMFLTAFVLRYFSEASKYVTIGNDTLIQMQNWITSKQQADGCFPDVGQIIHRDLQGGIEKDKSPGTITAYVLTSLLIYGYQNKRVLDGALSCIENSKDTSFYATFLYSYTEALAGKKNSAKERIKSVKGRAIKKGKIEYYHDVNGTKSQDIETAAYAVLSILKSGGTASEALPIVQYLSQNMNPRGGFFSTQDTCVGMEALGQFSKLTFRDIVDITIRTTGGLEKEIRITEEDKLIVKRYKIERVPSEVKVEAEGSGCAVVQTVLRYNTYASPEKRNFNLRVEGKCSDTTCKKGSISISVSYIPEDRKTGMAVIEVKMISGKVPLKESLDALLRNKPLELMRYDVENNVVVFYFNEITNNEKNFSFDVQEVIQVENSQPGTVKVYDYYNRDISSTASYSFKN